MASWVWNWAVFLAIVGGLGYFYTKDQSPNRANRRPVLHTETESQARRPEDTKTKKRKEKVAAPAERVNGVKKAAEVKVGLPETSGVNGVKQRKNVQDAKETIGGASSAVDVTNASVVVGTAPKPEKKVDDKEFARQLTRLKTGSSLKAPEQSNKRIKTKTLNAISRESGESSPASAPGVSTPSSTTGAFADDDFSASVSPEMETYSSTLDASGVSDMLEAHEPGPSVLRVTPSIQPQKVQQPKQPKPAQQDETKRQRQNRQKNEARKAELAEQEKARKAGLEAHRRSVRELEGRPAKNGESLRAAIPQTNAWSHSGTNGNNNKENVKSVQAHELLDTTEQQVKEVRAPEKPNGLGLAANGANGNTSTGSSAMPAAISVKPKPVEGYAGARIDHDVDLEEALRQSRAEAEHTQWTTVPAKSTKRKPTKVDEEEKRRQEHEVREMERRLGGLGYLDSSDTTS